MHHYWCEIPNYTNPHEPWGIPIPRLVRNPHNYIFLTSLFYFYQKKKTSLFYSQKSSKCTVFFPQKKLQNYIYRQIYFFMIFFTLSNNKGVGEICNWVKAWGTLYGSDTYLKPLPNKGSGRMKMSMDGEEINKRKKNPNRVSVTVNLRALEIKGETMWKMVKSKCPTLSHSGGLVSVWSAVSWGNWMAAPQKYHNGPRALNGLGWSLDIP